MRRPQTLVTYQLSGAGTEVGDAVELRSSAEGGNTSTDNVPNGFVFGARKAGLAYFKAMTPDGLAILPGFFEADLETGNVTQRLAITGPPVALSPDGERMLFIEAPPPPRSGDSGDWTLRYWHRANPNTSIAVATINSPVNVPPSGLIRAWEPSPDGQAWTFVAISNLDPERENNSPLTRQLYRWTVGQGAPTCLSCESVDGVARTTGVNLAVQDSSTSENFLTPTTSVSKSQNGSKPMVAQPPHGPSQDGRYLLFDSPDRLVARDTNDVRDVYLWDRDGGPNGKLYLLTSGRGNTPSWALDLSPDGKNAFFSTREGLVPGDNDRTYDVYTARVGNGFPDSPESCTAWAAEPMFLRRRSCHWSAPAW